MFPPGSKPRESIIKDDFQNIPYVAQSGPNQQSFYAYQSYFDDYPSDIAIKVNPSPTDPSCWGYFNYINMSGEQTWTYKYPDNIVTEYDPRYQDPPDPNGTTGTTTQNYPLQEFSSPYPRWKDDEPVYDFSSDGVAYDYWSAMNLVMVPKINYDYGFPGDGGYPPLMSSWSFSADNYESKVWNGDIDDYEYFPFKQDTVKYDGQGFIGFQNSAWPMSCFNDGTIIRGKVSIYSIDVTVTAVADPSTPGYGFGGISAVTGDEFTEHSELDWEVTISDSFTPPPNIDIPQEENKITFINDFWITEVIPPGGA
jgi:hypothetical protein